MPFVDWKSCQFHPVYFFFIFQEGICIVFTLCIINAYSYNCIVGSVSMTSFHDQCFLKSVANCRLINPCLVNRSYAGLYVLVNKYSNISMNAKLDWKNRRLSEKLFIQVVFKLKWSTSWKHLVSLSHRQTL